MSITEEMRKYIGSNVKLVHQERLREIADRIDAEHERELMSEYNDGALEVLSGDGYIELPKDADDVPIRIEDKLVLQHEVFEKPYVVENIAWDGEDWYFTCNEGFFNVAGWHHYHAPTVEDVLREFGDWYAHTKGGCDEDGIIAEYAAKLRLAGEDDD